MKERESLQERKYYFLSNLKKAREWLLGKKVWIISDKPPYSGGNRKRYTITEVDFQETIGGKYQVTVTISREDKRNLTQEIYALPVDDVKFAGYTRFPPRSKQWARQ